ncbi:MAG TPA: hypothetical protein VK420_03155 [Longimicrobium sp.]|nr:hypothetical protein [Longimicrobium sp.]
MMIRRIALALLLSLTVAGPLLAQERAAVSPGDRVRVTASSTPRTNGIVLETNPDTLVVRSGSETIYTAWADVRTLHVAEGGSRGRSAFKYGRIGLVAGAAAGMAAGLVAFDDDSSGDGPCLICSPVHAGVYGGVVLGIVGGALGSLAGAAFPEERWRPVKAPVTMSAGPAAGGGIALQGRLRF